MINVDNFVILSISLYHHVACESIELAFYIVYTRLILVIYLDFMPGCLFFMHINRWSWLGKKSQRNDDCRCNVKQMKQCAL